jgi:hypothetical protein
MRTDVHDGLRMELENDEHEREVHLAPLTWPVTIWNGDRRYGSRFSALPELAQGNLTPLRPETQPADCKAIELVESQRGFAMAGSVRDFPKDPGPRYPRRLSANEVRAWMTAATIQANQSS